jgi:hypothetical protein
MNPASSEDLLVGLIGLILLPLIAWRMLRGIRTGRLPLYRTYMQREESAAKFNTLLALHALSVAAVAAMTADLLFDLGFRSGR